VGADGREGGGTAHALSHRTATAVAGLVVTALDNGAPNAGDDRGGAPAGEAVTAVTPPLPPPPARSPTKLLEVLGAGQLQHYRDTSPSPRLSLARTAAPPPPPSHALTTTEPRLDRAAAAAAAPPPQQQLSELLHTRGVEDGVLYGGDPGAGGSARAFTLRPSLELKLLGDTLFAKILEHR
jgi:hypothetical protein